MKKLNKNLLVMLLAITAIPAVAQMQQGRWAVGGEFSFLNSRNDQSNSSNSFSETNSTGFNLNLLGGKFVSNKLYLYGIGGINYSKTRQNRESNLGGKDITRNLSTVISASLGGGVRRYFAATDRMGFFVQGQATFANTFVKNDVFYMDNDTVQNDTRVKYPFYSLSFNVNPGVYVNLAKRWQLTFNLGNLYFIQTWQPEKKDVVQRSRNASFGADINLFDFRIGALCFLGKSE